VKARLTPEGSNLLKPLDEPIRELHKRQFRHVAPQRLKMLGELLDQIIARQRP
jgi:hypothetical protein